MRILYGVVGDGMGHATRSRVVVDHLLERGHRVLVVSSGPACRFFQELYAAVPALDILPIDGLNMAFAGDRVSVARSLGANLRRVPRSLKRNLQAYRKVVARFRPEMIFSDFESLAYLIGKEQGIPVVSLDNIQALDRCRHAPEIVGPKGLSFHLARAVVKVKLPGAYSYLITSFFEAPVRKPRTSLVPPILRPEILAARRDRREHVLVYQSLIQRANLAGVLSRFPFEFRVYGTGRVGRDQNLDFRPFSQRGFVDDLRTARGVIATGGFSLMSEAVHLGVPMLAIPIRGQTEQHLNASYLESLGYGCRAERLEAGAVGRFLEGLDGFEQRLATYPRQDNRVLLACVDELVSHVAHGRPAPACLKTRAYRRLRVAAAA